MLFINTDTEDLGFVFVAIRKNASSSIANAIYSLKNNMPYGHPDFPIDINHTDIFLYDHPLKSPDVFKFTCVRDPFERLLSGFVHKVLKHPHEEIRQYTHAHPDHRSLIDEPIKYFDHFLSFLENHGLAEIDPHFALQYDCARFDKINYDIVLDQSSLFSDWKKIQERIVGMPDLLEHKVHYSGSETFISTLKPLFIERVKYLYSKDYELFKSLGISV